MPIFTPPGFWDWITEPTNEEIREYASRPEKQRQLALERARRDEAMAYQRAEDSRKALAFAIYHLMGDENAESNYYRGYYWNPHSLRYDIRQ